MIYSGADLIRTSGQQAERVQRLRPLSPAGAVAPVASTDNSESALLRFAHFLRQEREKAKAKPPNKAFQKKTSGNPYDLAEQRLQNAFGRGKILDIYI